MSKTAHGMRKLFVRPQPHCLCHVPSRSASRPLASLASELNEHQQSQLQLTPATPERKRRQRRVHCRKREGCCPAAPRFGYPVSPVTYTRITVHTIPEPAQEEPTSCIIDCGCLPRRVTQQAASSSSSSSSSKQQEVATNSSSNRYGSCVRIVTAAASVTPLDAHKIKAAAGRLCIGYLSYARTEYRVKQ